MEDETCLESYDELKELVNSMEKDVGRFRRGQKAPGTRIRKTLQLIKEQAHVMRKEVVDIVHKRGGW